MHKAIISALFIFVLAGGTYSASLAADHTPVALIRSGKVIEEAIKLHDDKKYKEAIEKYLTVSRNDTNYAWALTELAFSYLADSDTVNAVAIAQKGLKLNSEYQLTFYETLGDAYDNDKTFDKAIEAYNDGLKHFPYYFKFYFEMGIAYVRHHNDTAAMRCFQKSVRMNPLHPGSHLQLGYLAARNNKFTQALLSFQMFLMLENASSRSTKALRMIEQIGEGNYKPYSSDSVVDIANSNDHYEEIEEIIRSKSALTDKYKTNVKLNYLNLIKTLQVMNEKLKMDKQDKGFWMQTYVPFFTELWKDGYFEPFMYNSFASIDDEQVRKEIKNNKVKIDKYVDWATDYIVYQYPRDPLTVNGKSYPVTSRYYNNYHPKSIGQYDPKLKIDIGEWIYFYTTGILKSIGSYDSKGMATGEWKFYYPEGALKKTLRYENGKLNGPYQLYFKNGQLKEKGNYKNDLIDGNAQLWFAGGAHNADLNYKDGKQDGPIKVYYDNGLLRKEGVLKNDLYDGQYKEYYDNGQARVDATFMNGKQTGVYKFYHDNGALEKEGHLINGDEEGEWKYYFDSGKLQKTGIYKAGKENGLWKEYYEDYGKVESETNYVNGEMKGTYKAYDDDGIQYCEMQYDKTIKKYKYMDKTGKIAGQGEEKKGILDLKGYYPDGKTKKLEGQIINGKDNGQWIRYHSTGQKQNEFNYKDDKKDGEASYYFKNGKLKEKLTYKEGKREGHFISYYLNGNIDQEGWYADDEPVGDWIDYYSNSTLNRTRYFLEGTLTGYDVKYDESGRRRFEEYDDENKLPVYMSGFDTSGTELFNQSFVKGAGEYISVHLNKKPYQHCLFKNGKKDGEVTFSYANGQKFIIQRFEKGELNGPYLKYFDDGKLNDESFYKDGELDSITKNYYHNGTLHSQFMYHKGQAEGKGFWNFDNGKLFEEGQFKNDERDGYFTYYANDGVTVRFRAKYKDGDMLSYSYLDKSGNYVEEIPLKNQSGTIVAYYSNGTKSAEFTVENGYDEGRRTFYFPNGIIESDGVYKDDKLDGIVKEYYENGKIKSEEIFFFGNRQGVSKNYTDKGILKKQSTWVLGSKEGLTIYYDELTGKLKKKVQYVNDQPYE